MTDYVKFQCTICRRVKAYEDDNRRAIPTSCTITKGCQGSLLAVGQSTKMENPAPVAGLTDWFPRGKQQYKTEPAVVEEDVLLTTSTSGALTVAIKMSDVEAVAVSDIQLNMLQRKIEAVSFNQFIFRTSAVVNPVISGRDTQGKNLRIDSLAMSEDRVRVRVNGVMTENFSIAPDGRSVTLTASYPVGSSVDVIVYNEKDVVNVVMTLTANKLINTADNRGAWSNIGWFELFNAATGMFDKYWVFGSSELSGISQSSKLRFDRVLVNGDVIDNSRVLFLIAYPPFAHADRNITEVIRATTLNEEFSVLSSSSLPRTLSVPPKFIDSVYPPLRIRRGVTVTSLSFDDVIPDSIADIESDTTNTIRQNTFINGPA